MEPSITPPATPVRPWYAPLCVVTPLSKIVAGLLFVFLPFGAFFLGMSYGPFGGATTASCAPATIPPTNEQCRDFMASPVADLTPPSGEVSGMPTIVVPPAAQSLVTVEQCAGDVGLCFGSGRVGYASTTRGAVYELISPEGQVGWGLVDETTGDLYTIRVR